MNSVLNVAQTTPTQPTLGRPVETCVRLIDAHALDARSLDPDGPISRQVMAILGLAYPASRIERRREQRFPYPHLVYLTPCSPDGCPQSDSSIVVVGKHLSRSGLGFFHREPIAQRRMYASLEGRAGLRVAFLIDITWCRFNGHGWYDSGGRFLEVVTSPV